MPHRKHVSQGTLHCRYKALNRLLDSSYGVERKVQSGTALPFVERIGTQEYDEFGISYDAIGNIEKLNG